MEGLVRIRLSFAQRMLVVRAITLVPTLVLALLYGQDDYSLNLLNQWVRICFMFHALCNVLVSFSTFSNV